MNIIQYELHLTDLRHPILVQEKVSSWAGTSLHTADSVVDMLNTCFFLNRKAEEHLVMLALSSSLQVLGTFEISHGTVNASLASPREIFIRALLCGATSIVVAHNHPSGSLEPSREDKQTYYRLCRAGDLLGIQLLDFLVIAGEGFFSFSMD